MTPQDNLFTFESLATLGGASLLVFFITSFTKGLLDRIFPRVPTDIFVIFISFIVVYISSIAAGANLLDWKTLFLSFANSFLVASTASYTHIKATTALSVSDNPNKFQDIENDIKEEDLPM